MSEKRYREDMDVIEAPPTAPLAPGRMPASAKLFPGAMLMRKGAGGVAAGAEDAVARASGSSGSSLPDAVRSKFESSLGADLSGVRVHTGSESAEAASSVGARAYTIGNDIHFGEGQYAPSDPFGLHLLAHEVAHTQQQAGGASHRQHKLEVSSAGDAAEVEADRAADAMVSGGSFALSSASSLIARKGVETGGGVSISGSKDSEKITAKATLEKEVEAKWVTITLGGEYSVDAVIERKKKGESKEGGKEGGKEEKVDLASYKGEAESASSAKLKSEMESHAEAEKGQFDADLEPPEIELGKDGGGAGITLKVKLKNGKEIPVKASFFELKKGKLEGPAIEVDFPIKLAETELWSNANAKVSVSTTIMTKIKVKPNWMEIGKAAMEKFGDKILEMAEKSGEVILDAAAAAGECAIMTAGFVALAASMVFAGVMEARETAEINSTIGQGRIEIERATAAAMDGYGFGSGGSAMNGDSFLMSAYNAAWHQVAEAYVKAVNDPKFAKVKPDLNDSAFRAQLSEKLAPSTDILFARAHAAAVQSVSKGMAQAYYDAHKNDFMKTKDHVSVEAQLICGSLGGDSSWSPVRGPDTDDEAKEDDKEEPSVAQNIAQQAIEKAKQQLKDKEAHDRATAPTGKVDVEDDERQQSYTAGPFDLDPNGQSTAS
ncbi:MAG TPA: DUF4157 domain-containing protein [Kofleriaceae bacterium]|nr:DUF4157 domain-containing protein [Kofleriaceae bacterium]